MAVTQGSVVVRARLVQAVAQALVQAAQGCGKDDSGLRFGREKMKRLKLLALPGLNKLQTAAEEPFPT